MSRARHRVAALGCCVFLAGCGGASAGAPASATVTTQATGESSAPLNREAVSLARDVWGALDRTANTCEELYDYFPEGGARIFSCHLFSLTSFEQIVATSRLTPFLSGPHGQGLDFTSRRDFGHYNPEFVRFLADHAIPAASDPAFRAATQAHYDQYVRPLARIMHATHEKLANDRACAQAELDDYSAAIARGGTVDYVEPWYFFMNERYCSQRRADFEAYEGTELDGGYDGNVVKTAVGFWLRRTLDGTDALFFEALVRLMNTYERPAN